MCQRGCAQKAFWPAQLGKLVINQNASVNGKALRGINNSIRGNIDASSADFCLQPLQKHVNDISLHSGIDNKSTWTRGKGDPHKACVQGALTGAQPGGGNDTLFDNTLIITD